MVSQPFIYMCVCVCVEQYTIAMVGGIKTIMTLTGKENFLGDEILHIKHRSVKFKINMIITTEFLNR